MAASDFRRLGLDPGCEHLLGLGCDYLVLRADHIERRFIAPGRRIDWSFVRRVL
jgi:hypothetical protein